MLQLARTTVPSTRRPDHEIIMDPLTNTFDPVRCRQRIERQQQRLRRLHALEDDLNRRLAQVVAAARPLGAAFIAARLTSDTAPELADGLLHLGTVVRAARFERGLELLLAQAAGATADSEHLAGRLFALASAGQREPLLDLLAFISTLPSEPDAFDSSLACRRHVAAHCCRLLQILLPHLGMCEPLPAWLPEWAEIHALDAECRAFTTPVPPATPPFAEDRDRHDVSAGANAGFVQAEPPVPASSDAVAEAATAQPWLTIQQAESISAINRGVISRAVSAGKIRSNGQRGRQRRLDSADFTRWHLQRVQRATSVI